ncbi:MAG: N-acetylmuramoyl-L-alanine amidase [Actinobacteria bacterium]|nr:N-acetylmuramoyl-L-alanine amidase [Actinomycetota bacterium]
MATLLFLGACSASGPHPRPATRAPATAATTPPSTTIGPAPAAAPPTTGPPPSSSHAPTRTLDPGPATTARTASQEVAGLAGATVVIDPGHNGGNSSHAAQIARPVFIGTGFRACDTTGTNTADGYTEAAYNLDVALRLAAILRAGGANVVLTRTSNEGVGPCIDERAAIGNRAHAAVAISIHADGGPPAGRGFHVNYPALVRGSTDGIVGPSYRLALDLRAAYQAGTGMPPSTYVGSGGLVARSDFGGLNLSTVPKVLFETANMRNATDAALTENAAFRQRVAQAFASGLAAFLTGK